MADLRIDLNQNQSFLLDTSCDGPLANRDPIHGFMALARADSAIRAVSALLLPGEPRGSWLGLSEGESEGEGEGEDEGEERGGIMGVRQGWQTVDQSCFMRNWRALALALALVSGV